MGAFMGGDRPDLSNVSASDAYLIGLDDGIVETVEEQETVNRRLDCLGLAVKFFAHNGSSVDPDDVVGTAQTFEDYILS